MQVRWITLGTVLLIAFWADISVGAVKINVLEILRGFCKDEVVKHILFNFRLPKTLTAVLVGAALSVAGLIMQTFFSNPLASPSELGVSAGASLGVASITLSSGISWQALYTIDIWTNGLVVFGAIIGATIVTLLLFGISFWVQSNTTLLLVGLMLGSLVVSLIGLWQFLSSPEQIRDFLWWSFGSLASTNYSQILILFFLFLLVSLLLLAQLHKLNALLLGEEYACTMGVNVRHMRWILIFIVGILSGASTAFCGPISFIGLAVPHITRSLFQTANHWVLVPATAMMGAIVLLTCDVLSFNIYKGLALPINLVTSLIGSPVAIWIIFRQRRSL